MEDDPSGPGDGRAPVAVVGAGGFIGRHLCRELVAAGFAVARFGRARPPVVGSDDHPVLHPAARHATTVFHLATSVDLEAARDHPERARADVRRWERLLLALAVGPPRTVVLASSALVYAPDEDPPVAETAPTAPTSEYAATKLRMEERLGTAAPTVRPVAVRLASTYGPGQDTLAGHGVVSHWLRAVRDGRPVTLLGDDDVRRDFVHVRDVAAALVALHVAARDGRRLPPRLNVSGGEPVTLGELLDAVVAAAPGPVRVDRRPARDIDRRSMWLDIRLARDLLGWAPLTSIRAGVAETLASAP